MPRLAVAEVVRLLVVFGLILQFYLSASPSAESVPAGYASPQEYKAARVSQLRTALDALDASQWGDLAPDQQRYLNVTGFRASDHYAWDRFREWQERRDDLVDVARGSRVGAELAGEQQTFYSNVTGTVRGRWTRYHPTSEQVSLDRMARVNLSAIAPDVSWTTTDLPWERNVTGHEGRLTIKFDERNGRRHHESSAGDVAANDTLKSPPVDISATVVLVDSDWAATETRMRLHGVHWPEHGSMLLTTTSAKFAGIFGLPHLARSEDDFETARHGLHETMLRTIDQMKKSPLGEADPPWMSTSSSEDASVMPHCEYVLSAQLHPVAPRSSMLRSHPARLDEIENDLRHPSGMPTPEVPSMRIAAILFSPDCGFILESKGPPTWSPASFNHLLGSKLEIDQKRAHDTFFVLALLIGVQAYLMKRQFSMVSTPASMTRISLLTLGALLLGDGEMFSTLTLLCASETTVSSTALVAAFSCLMSLAIGAKFCGALHDVQASERPVDAPAPRPVPDPQTPVVSGDVLPRTRNDIANTPVIIPYDQDLDFEIDADRNRQRQALPNADVVPAGGVQQIQPERATFGAAYGQFVLVLLIVLFVTLASLSWPAPIRQAWIYGISFLYLSFWTPQIYRNMLRNCRLALSWEFVIGQSVLRVLPYAYFLLHADNVLAVEPDVVAFYCLAGWVWVQVCTLIAQDILGPRFAVPRSWWEPGWDYHPLLYEDQIEAGTMPLGLMPGASGSDRDAAHAHEAEVTMSVDCAICMQRLEMSVARRGSKHASALGTARTGLAAALARRAYMVTPCRHIFHRKCLEGWMSFRLQCPICRESLPPC